MSATEQFDKALAGLVNSERQAVYGHPADDFRRAVALKEIVSECKDPIMRHVLEMIAVKMARLIQTPTHYDSWIDCAGYARTAMMVLDHRAETNPAPNMP